MAKFCIPRPQAEKFKKALASKKINIGELINMESAARTKIFEEFFGETAKDVNTLFETKLVLKNRIQGLKNWASKVGEIGRYDPAKKIETDKLMAEFKEKQRKRLFSPAENEAFLSDLVESKMGTRITEDEAMNVFNMTNQVEKFKKNYDPKTEIWTSQEAANQYGAAKVAMENYVGELKGEELSIKDMAKGRVSEFKQVMKENRPKAVFDVFKDTTKGISDNLISLLASWDNSFLGRQGLKTWMTHPTVWWNMAGKSFKDFALTIGGKNMEDALWAGIYGRPNYMNGNYQKAKLIPKFEEQYPSTLPEKIPGLGRVFKASEVAFTGSAIRARTDLFDLFHGIAKSNGVEIDKTWVKDFGRMINSLTAKGQLGERGDNPLLRLVLWAPKMIKGNYDVLTMHTLGAGLETKGAQKEAAKNLAKVVGVTSLILAIAISIDEDSVELDPRSADFVKIKIGNTRFDITGGAASLIVLAARLIPVLWGGGATKSTTTGIVTALNSGDYGSKTGLDVFIDFLGNKTSPFAGIVVDKLKGQTFEGKDPTIRNELYGKTVPISVQNVIGLKDDSSVGNVLGAILDFAGINAATYGDEATMTYQKLLELDPEEANAELKKIYERDESLYKKIIKASEGWTAEDRAIQRMDIIHKERAKYVYGKLKKLKTPEEKDSYLKDLEDKNIVTPEVRKQIEKLLNAKYKWQELGMTQKEYVETRSTKDLVKDYWHAFNTDSGNAWKALLGPEKLDVVKGELVELQRFYGIEFDEKGGSQEYKKELMEVQGLSWDDAGDYKLEHIVPRIVGGGNEPGNLYIETNELHDSYIKVEVNAGMAVIEGRLTRKEAEKLFKDLKINKTLTLKELEAKLKSKKVSSNNRRLVAATPGSIPRTAFVVPKEEGLGFKDFSYKNVDKFEYVPHFDNPKKTYSYTYGDEGYVTDVAKMAEGGDLTVGDVINHPLLDDPKYKDIKNAKLKMYKEPIGKNKSVGRYNDGTFGFGEKIKVFLSEKPTQAQVIQAERTLIHEVQHAIDERVMKEKVGDSWHIAEHEDRPIEQLTRTGDILFEAEYLYSIGEIKTLKDVDNYFKELGTIENKSIRNQWAMAEKLFYEYVKKDLKKDKKRKLKEKIKKATEPGPSLNPASRIA